MQTHEIQRIASQIFTANQRGDRFEPLTGVDKPASLADAYRIQDQVYHLFATEGGLGELGGHKIALTSQAVQQLCGVSEPAYGSIFRSQIYSSGHQVNTADFVRLGLEFEIAVEIGTDVPPGRTDWDKDSIAPYVRACMPAFELIEDRDADYSRLDAASILTARCWCDGIVRGPVSPGWQQLDLSACEVSLWINGERIDQGRTGDSMGHPLNGLAWIACHLAEQGRQLKQGEFVMTGSALKTQVARAGDQVEYRVDGLGSVAVQITGE